MDTNFLKIVCIGLILILGISSAHALATQIDFQITSVKVPVLTWNVSYIKDASREMSLFTSPYLLLVKNGNEMVKYTPVQYTGDSSNLRAGAKSSFMFLRAPGASYDLVLVNNSQDINGGQVYYYSVDHQLLQISPPNFTENLISTSLGDVIYTNDVQFNFLPSCDGILSSTMIDFVFSKREISNPNKRIEKNNLFCYDLGSV